MTQGSLLWRRERRCCHCWGVRVSLMFLGMPRSRRLLILQATTLKLGKSRFSFSFACGRL